MDLILSLILHKTATLPQQHYHSNTTTATLPQQHYHSNTTTATLPQQHYHSNTVTGLTSSRPSSFILSASRTFLMAPRWISTRSGKSCIRPRYSFSTSRAGNISYLGWGTEGGGMEGVEGCTLYYNEHSSLTEEEETV